MLSTMEFKQHNEHMDFLFAYLFWYIFVTLIATISQ